MKICSQCNETKELNEFYFRNDTNSYRNTCKLCFKLAIETHRSKPGIKEQRALKEKERRKLYKLKINKRLYELRSTPEAKQRIKLNAEKVKIANPEKYKAISLRSRANYISLKKVADSSPKKDIEQWIKGMPKTCEYCYSDCENTYHIDHIELLSKGGSNTIDNFAIACPSCNHSKHNHQLVIWFILRNNRSK